MGAIKIKSEQELDMMRAAGRITAGILDEVGELVKPGISTEEIDSFVHRRMKDQGAIPATLGYHGFPKSSCTSVNDVVCHGIPSPYEVLKVGDIVNIDITSIKDGFHGDASRMFLVGGIENFSDEVLQLIEHTKQALQAGIDSVKDGSHVGDIGAAIEAFIASTKKDYGIVREYTGHGLGREFHEAPQIIHVGKKGAGPKLGVGMTFTIEPMINLGTAKTKLSKVDGWTVRTADGKLSAQWEHTIAITKKGVEKLTQSLAGFDY